MEALAKVLGRPPWEITGWLSLHDSPVNEDGMEVHHHMGTLRGAAVGYVGYTLWRARGGEGMVCARLISRWSANAYRSVVGVSTRWRVGWKTDVVRVRGWLHGSHQPRVKSLDGLASALRVDSVRPLKTVEKPGPVSHGGLSWRTMCRRQAHFTQHIPPIGIVPPLTQDVWTGPIEDYKGRSFHGGRGYPASIALRLLVW